MKAPPEDVKLSREDGEALIVRLQADSLTGDDRRLLVKLIRVYFWFTFALSETKISLTRLKRALFGDGKPPPSPPPAGGAASGGADAGGGGTSAERVAVLLPRPADLSMPVEERAARRRGHGRQGAAVYTGAERSVCRHDTLTAGQRCPACGRGTWYPLPAGVEMRLDGNALLSAIR